MVQQGYKIPFGSFHTAEAAARAYDGWAAATPGRALDVSTGDELGSANAPRQRPALTTPPGAHALGLPEQQRNDDDDDEPEQLTDSDGSDGYDGGAGAMNIGRARRGFEQREAPAAGAAHGSKADCALYVGVCFVEGTANPFQARINLKGKKYHICCCPTVEAAARAYDAVACMIPGRALNFPTTAPAAASSSRQRKGASGVPEESDILAAIAALRQAQPPTGAVKYIGVSIDRTSARNVYQAGIKIDGKREHLGYHPTAEAAARAYDAVARTISGRRLKFPTGGSRAATASGIVRPDAQSLHALGASQPSQPPRFVHDDVGSPSTAASARPRKRKQPSSSQLSLPRAAAGAQIPVRQQRLRQMTYASAAEVHRSLQPMQQLPHSDAHVDHPARRSILELFIAGIDEEGEPLNGPSHVDLHDLTVAEHLALIKRP
jgi:hypothetical protein